MSKFQSLKNILPKVLLENKLSTSIIIDSIKKEWLLKLSPVYTNILKPEKFNPYTKTLFLKTSSSLWANEMLEKEKEILNKIKDVFPEIEIKHLKFTI